MQKRRGVARPLAAQRLERIVIGVAARVPVLPDLLLRFFVSVRAHLVIVDGAERLVKFRLVRHGGKLGIFGKLHGKLLQILRGNGILLRGILLIVPDRCISPAAGAEGKHHCRSQQQSKNSFHVG